jgi:hypothetical protein
MEIVQIVPQFPPAVNGLGDYAFHLARELQSFHDIRSKIIVGDPRRTPSESEGFIKQPIARRTGSALLEALEADRTDTVLLHYVGYGYAKRGCPFWLVRGIRQWKPHSRRRRLITIFHELYAKGQIWQSSFWLSPFQKALAEELAQLSYSAHTTMVRYAQILRSWNSTLKVTTLPVFSTIGETSQQPALEHRKHQLVVFGGAPLRRKIYTLHASELLRAARVLEIEKVVDVGPPIGINVRLPIAIERAGYQSPDVIRNVLKDSVAGFVFYYDGYLAKSSVFAAYCAHGVMPILPTNNNSDIDGVVAGREYMTALDTEMPLSLEKAQRIASNAQAWYAGHSISRTAATLAAVLTSLQH